MRSLLLGTAAVAAAAAGIAAALTTTTGTPASAALALADVHATDAFKGTGSTVTPTGTLYNANPNIFPDVDASADTEAGDTISRGRFSAALEKAQRRRRPPRRPTPEPTTMPTTATPATASPTRAVFPDSATVNAPRTWTTTGAVLTNGACRLAFDATTGTLRTVNNKDETWSFVPQPKTRARLAFAADGSLSVVATSNNDVLFVVKPPTPPPSQATVELRLYDESTACVVLGHVNGRAAFSPTQVKEGMLSSDLTQEIENSLAPPQVILEDSCVAMFRSGDLVVSDLTTDERIYTSPTYGNAAGLLLSPQTGVMYFVNASGYPLWRPAKGNPTTFTTSLLFVKDPCMLTQVTNEKQPKFLFATTDPVLLTTDLKLPIYFSPNIHVVPLFWGSSWTQPQANATVQGMMSFVRHFGAARAYLDPLAEYLDDAKPVITSASLAAFTSARLPQPKLNPKKTKGWTDRQKQAALSDMYEQMLGDMACQALAAEMGEAPTDAIPSVFLALDTPPLPYPDFGQCYTSWYHRRCPPRPSQKGRRGREILLHITYSTQFCSNPVALADLPNFWAYNFAYSTVTQLTVPDYVDVPSETAGWFNPYTFETVVQTCRVSRPVSVPGLGASVALPQYWSSKNKQCTRG